MLNIHFSKHTLISCLSSAAMLCTMAFLLCLPKAQAQDPHFSQFYVAPMIFNPALAGTYEGNFRASAIYRDQWTGALADPLTTVLVSGDVSFDLNGSKRNAPDKVAVGMAFYNDRVSTFDLNTNQLSLYGAYHKSLDERSRRYLSAGLQLGMTQRSVNYEDLRFGDQFNSIDGYTLPSGELLPPNNIGHLDLGVGINLSQSPVGGTQYYIGAALFHLTGSNISFYQNDTRVDDKLVRENALNRKITAQAGMSMLWDANIAFQPRAFYMKQGNHQEADLGANFRFKFDNHSGATYFHIGPYVRAVNNIDGFGLESVVLAAGYERGSLIFGLSYDHNVKDLVSDRTGLNAFEFSVTFIGEHANEVNICPEF